MRKFKDCLLNIFTNLFSTFGILTLIAILIFIFTKGFSTLNFDFIFGDNKSKLEIVTVDVNNEMFKDPNIEGSYFSDKWGISLMDSKNTLGEDVVVINYIDNLSPLKRTNDVTSKEIIEIKEGQEVSQIILRDNEDNLIIAVSRDGAEKMVGEINKADHIQEMKTISKGGGIRGSLITTILLILLTLVIAMPIGIITAIYLNEFAPKNKITGVIRTMIDMTSGIPSVVFGLLGMLIFIPFMNKVIGSDGGSIASGALTLTTILLPTIIKTTEESLKVIPDSLRNASLALGSSYSQMIYKVVLPNAMPGILTSIILSIGRIIGESAALIYAIGTSISDTVAINEMSTSLAVHMWAIMSGENPNFEAACAIAIIILILTLILILITKLISKKFNKFEVK